MKNSIAIIVGAIASTILVGGIYKIVTKPNESTLALQELTRQSEQLSTDLKDTSQTNFEANNARLNRLITVTDSPLCKEYQGKTAYEVAEITSKKILATSSRQEELEVYELSDFCVPERL